MLFTLLVRELTEGSDESGLPEQISELLKTLLDPDTMETAIEKNEVGFAARRWHRESLWRSAGCKAHQGGSSSVSENSEN